MNLSFEKVGFFENKLSFPLIREFFEIRDFCEIKEDVKGMIYLTGKKDILISLTFTEANFDFGKVSQEQLKENLINQYKQMG